MKAASINGQGQDFAKKKKYLYIKINSVFDEIELTTNKNDAKKAVGKNAAFFTVFGHPH
jgi:hypothetical protein